MTPGYISWDNNLLRPLLHGVVANIPIWYFGRQLVHGHCCADCQHRIACTCLDRNKLDLVRCAWCTPTPTPWLMQWAKPPPKKAPKKRARRKVTRRLARAVL